MRSGKKLEMCRTKEAADVRKPVMQTKLVKPIPPYL